MVKPFRQADLINKHRSWATASRRPPRRRFETEGGGPIFLCCVGTLGVTATRGAPIMCHRDTGRHARQPSGGTSVEWRTATTGRRSPASSPASFTQRAQAGTRHGVGASRDRRQRSRLPSERWRKKLPSLPYTEHRAGRRSRRPEACECPLRADQLGKDPVWRKASPSASAAEVARFIERT
jgi:hypothetical protein